MRLWYYCTPCTPSANTSFRRVHLYSASLHVVLLLILTHFTSAGTIYGMYKSNRCYSCMSEWYEPLFRKGDLNRWFFEPKNFTRACDEPARTSQLDLVSCRTICLTVQQELTIIGHRTGQMLTMRGCALSIARRGIYNHTLALFDRYDVCRDMNAADLFKMESRGDSQRIKVCSCLGDRLLFHYFAPSARRLTPTSSYLFDFRSAAFFWTRMLFLRIGGEVCEESMGGFAAGLDEA